MRKLTKQNDPIDHAEPFRAPAMKSQPGIQDKTPGEKDASVPASEKEQKKQTKQQHFGK